MNSSQATVSNTSKATVLVVDDELELLDIFSTWLRRSGYRVLTAPNGGDALKVLALEQVDAIISDVRMPIMDGVTLVRRIHEAGLTIPSIIFVSGFGPADPREMCALGVEAMLEKPLSRKDLLRALEECLMDRDQLWLTPLPEPMQQAASIDIDAMNDATRAGQFQLGRGGCCFPCDQPLAEDQTIDLTVLFTRPGPCLNAQGKVRWYSAECRLAGVAFRYLDPACRDWVIGLIEAGKPSSFIPLGSDPIDQNAHPDYVLVEAT